LFYPGNGSNQDLNEAVQKGKFRKDLLARINLWSFVIPDLKDRREDIEPNLEHELILFQKKTTGLLSLQSSQKNDS
jgi:transcriptional regulatory protein RtcR